MNNWIYLALWQIGLDELLAMAVDTCVCKLHEYLTKVYSWPNVISWNPFDILLAPFLIFIHLLSSLESYYFMK